MKTIHLLLLSSLIFSNPTELTAVSRFGQTFITFTEDGATSYRIYRSNSKIVSLTGLSPTATIAANSGFNPAGGRHIITDLGTPLDAGKGLLVLTHKTIGNIYYAVTSVKTNIEDSNMIQNVNTLGTPVYEDSSQRPRAVLTSAIPSDSNSNGLYRFYIWMDYENWPHGNEYYGSKFTVTESKSIRNRQHAPLYMYLHALNSPDGVTEDMFMQDMIRINIWDYNNSWWFGSGNNNYTQRRLLTSIYSVINDTQRFNIDTNRIYLEGQSMGAKGTMHMGICFPELFACLMPKLAPIYSWMIDTIALHPERELPPIIDFFGFRDSDVFGLSGHRFLYNYCFANHLGIFGKWQNIGHQAGGTTDIVQGKFSRFLKNEAYPAFTRSTRDWNYGQFPEKALDSAGYLNSYFDWSSSLHQLTSVPNDTLIDCTDSIIMVLRSSRANALVDVTIRRIQRFLPAAGTKCFYINKVATTGTIVDNGEITYNGRKNFTIPQLTLSTPGNRLSIKLFSDTKSEQNGILANRENSGVLIYPNPLNPSTRISFESKQDATVTIMNIRGSVIRELKVLRLTANNCTTEWDGKNNAGNSVASGVYFAKGSVLGKKIFMHTLLLNK